MKKLAIVILAAQAFTFGSELPARFFKALNTLETQGRTGAILGDHGRALGPLQIHYSYFLDSGVKGNYLNCSDLEFSKKVVSAYLSQYGKQYIARRDLVSLARLHNEGIRVTNSSAVYGLKFKKILDRTK